MGPDLTNETWADEADVFRFTGETVGEPELAQAQAIIDLFSGTTFASVNNISPRNLRHLRMAVAYQAAWIGSHPDIYTHLDVQSVSQAGASYSPGHENARLLSPFSLRCLRRLTWQQKPLRVRGRYGIGDDDTPRDSAVADDNRTWTPIL